MRQNFIKTTFISLIALLSLTAFFISDGFARHHRRDHSDFHPSKIARKFKERQEKRALQRARLKNKKGRNLSHQKKKTVVRGKAKPVLSKSAAPSAQRRTSGNVFPAGLLYLKSQGNIQKIRRDLIRASHITRLQHRRLNFITHIRMPPRTRLVLYGFSGLITANFDIFVRLMLNRKKNDVFLLGYFS